jgi:hypothetical protein
MLHKSIRVGMYVSYNVVKHVHMWATMGTITYISRKVNVRYRTNIDELLGFAGVVYSFLYFLVGHFLGKGALVRFDIILMIR